MKLSRVDRYVFRTIPSWWNRSRKVAEKFERGGASGFLGVEYFSGLPVTIVHVGVLLNLQKARLIMDDIENLQERRDGTHAKV